LEVYFIEQFSFEITMSKKKKLDIQGKN